MWAARNSWWYTWTRLKITVVDLSIFKYSGEQKSKTFFIGFFLNNLVKIKLYFSKKKSINIRFNIIFCAPFNDILLDKYNSILTKLF